MNRYLYSVVHCVPDPRTGEFVSVGAIAGDPSSGDWSIRQASNESRIRKLASVPALTAVHGFLARIGDAIEKNQAVMESGSGEPLDESWLKALYYDHRNVVQLTPPTPIVAEDAEQALDILFSRLIIDPVSQGREKQITKHRIISDLRDAYRRANVGSYLVHPRADIYVGSHVHTPLDFAIANGTTVQLAQGWSFQRTGLDEVAVQVKSWAYAMDRLRNGDEARVISADQKVSDISRDVDLEVVVAMPKTSEQREVYQEAEQVFSQLRANVRSLENVNEVGTQAAVLLGKG